jgi:hypothetical protein
MFWVTNNNIVCSRITLHSIEAGHIDEFQTISHLDAQVEQPPNAGIFEFFQDKNFKYIIKNNLRAFPKESLRGSGAHCENTHHCWLNVAGVVCNDHRHFRSPREAGNGPN